MQRFAGLLAAAIVLPGLAMADSKLTLVLGGEGFGGPPRFAVSFDGKPVGDAAVDAAIDTTKAGRFADAADKAKYVQSFDFEVPDALFKPDGLVAVKLTNEAHGAAGSKDDRQLYLQSVAVNGDEVPASKFAMRSAAGVEPTAMLGDFLVISAAAVEGVAAAPNGGWPQPAPAVASAAAPAADKPAEASPAPAAAATPPAKPADAPAPQPPAPTEKAAVPVQPAPPPDRPVSAAAANDSPDANPNPEANEPDCGLSKSFQILGFNENSNDLTPRTRKALDLVVEAIGTQKCVVHLTGYSSTEGDIAHNALFSIERAQNALHYLTQQGVKFRRYSANGVGETRQFGPDPNANRRVVVTVSP